MKNIFAFLIPMLIIASCTDPFDDSKIWDKLNEHENKINDIENGGDGNTNNGTDISGDAFAYR